MSPIDGTFSSSFRNRALINGLINLGNYVDIVTIYPYDIGIDMSKSQINSSCNILKLGKNYIEIKQKNIKILQKGGENYISRFFRKLYHKFIPYDSSLFILKKEALKPLIKKDYDVVISSSDPKTSHIAARSLFRLGLKSKKWIQYWGDPLASDISSKLAYPQIVKKKIEKSLLEGADKIVYVSPITTFEQKNIFKDIGDKMFFIPIPYEKEKIFPETNNKIYKIGYHGFYMKSIRNIFPLYNAVKELGKDVELEIIGSSDLNLQNSTNIKILPSTNNINQYEVKTDLFVVILNLNGSQIPGKLYHLAATNRPVLVILDGDYVTEVHEYLIKFKRFVLCKNDKDEIKSAIKNIVINNKKYQPCSLLNSLSIAKAILE